MTDSSDNTATATLSKNVTEAIVLTFGILILIVAKHHLLPSGGEVNILYAGIFGVIACCVIVAVAAIDQYVFKNIVLGMGVSLGLLLYR
jgi:hypothetical protein